MLLLPPPQAEFRSGRPGRSIAPRPERFGRYDPVMHQLIVDAQAHHGSEGRGAPPIVLQVSERGRLAAVIDAGLLGEDRAQTAFNKIGLQREALGDHIRDVKHELEGLAAHGKHHVARNEDFGRYDPITSTIAFQPIGCEAEETIKVGDKGRLRTVLESGKLSKADAASIGMGWKEMYPRVRHQHAWAKSGLNPITGTPLSSRGETKSALYAPRASGRRSGYGLSLTPVDPVTSTPNPRARGNTADTRVQNTNLWIATHPDFRMPVPRAAERAPFGPIGGGFGGGPVNLSVSPRGHAFYSTPRALTAR